MRTYYRGGDADVTDAHFVWHTSPPKIFTVGDLQDVVKVRAAPSRTGSYAVLLGGASILLMAAAWPAVAVTGPAWTAAVALLIVSAFAVAAHRWRRSHRWELHAVYRGRSVVIYSTDDVQAYNQITRGLRRALEASGPRRVWAHKVTPSLEKQGNPIS